MTHERDQDRRFAHRREDPAKERAASHERIAPGKISTSSLMRRPVADRAAASEKMQVLLTKGLGVLDSPDELDAVLTQMEEVVAPFAPKIDPQLVQDLVRGRRIHLMPGTKLAPGRISLSGLMSKPETRVDHEAARERHGAGCHDDILLQLPAGFAPGRITFSSYLRRPADPTPSGLDRPFVPPVEKIDEQRRGAAEGTIEEPAAAVEEKPAAPERLAPPVLDQMEQRFGTTFAQVELYTASPEVAGATKALAHDNEVHFAPGAYQPDTLEGERILAHELAHLVQLRGAGKPGTRDELEAEADRAAWQVTRGERVNIELSAATGVYTHTEGGGSAPASAPKSPGPQTVPARGSYVVEQTGGSYVFVFNTFDRNHWSEPVLTGLRYYMHQVFPNASDQVVRAVFSAMHVHLEGNGSAALPLDRRYELTVDPKIHEAVVAWMSSHHPEHAPHAPKPGTGALRSMDAGASVDKPAARHDGAASHLAAPHAESLAADAAHTHARSGATHTRDGIKDGSLHGDPDSDTRGWHRWAPKGELRLQPAQPTYVAGSTINAELAWDLSVHPDAAQVLLPHHCTYAWTVHRGGKLVDSGGRSVLADDRRADLRLGSEPGTYAIEVTATSPHFKAARQRFSLKAVVRAVSELAFDRAAFDAQFVGADAAFSRDALGTLHLRPDQTARTIQDELGNLDMSRGGIDAFAAQGKITGDDRDVAADQIDKRRAEIFGIQAQVADGTPYVVRGTFVSREDSSTTPLQLMMHVLRRDDADGVASYELVLHDTTFGDAARHPGSSSGRLAHGEPGASYGMLEDQALAQMAEHFHAHNDYPRGTVHLAAQRLADESVWEKTLDTDNGRKTAKKILGTAGLIGGAALLIIPGGSVVSAGLMVLTSTAGVASVALEDEDRLAKGQLRLDRRLAMDVLQVAAVSLPFGTLTKTFAAARGVGKTRFLLCMTGLDVAQGFVIAADVKLQLSVIDANTAVQLAGVERDDQRKAIYAERDRRVAEILGGAVVNGGFLLASLDGGIKQHYREHAIGSRAAEKSVFAAPGHAAPELEALLPPELRDVPVIRSTELHGTEVRVRYRDGAVQIEAGPEATSRHVADHAATVRRLRRFEGPLGFARRLVDSVRTKLRLTPGYGTAGFEARAEVAKLRQIERELVSIRGRLENGARVLDGDRPLEVRAVDTEIERVQDQLEDEAARLDSYEPGRGFVAVRDMPIYPLAASPDVIHADVLPERNGEFTVQFTARAKDGRKIALGKGSVKCSPDGLPLGYPDFVLYNDVDYLGTEYKARLYEATVDPGGEHVPLPAGEPISLTRYAIDRFIEFYSRRFGHEPDALGGGLAWENKRNFQIEFRELITQGVNSRTALFAAAKRISYGRHRIEAGYSRLEISVESVSDWVPLDLNDGKGSVRVPQWISIIGRKP